MRTKICLLTSSQAFELEDKGIAPPCHEHRHISRATADKLLQEMVTYREDSGDFTRLIEVRWIGKGKKYLAFVRSRNWKRMESSGVTVMQLVPGGGAW